MEYARIINVCDSISRLSRLLFSGCNSLRAKYYVAFIGRKHRELNWALWSLWVNGLCPSDIGQFSFHIHSIPGGVCHISRMGNTLEFVGLSLLDLQSYHFNMKSQFYLSIKRQPTFTYVLFTFLYKTNIYTDKQKRNWTSVILLRRIMGDLNIQISLTYFWYYCWIVFLGWVSFWNLVILYPVCMYVCMSLQKVRIWDSWGQGFLSFHCHIHSTYNNGLALLWDKVGV